MLTISGSINLPHTDNSAVVNIVNVNSGKCIDNGGGSQTAGNQFGQYDCNGNNNMKFSATLSADGSYSFINLVSGMCMDVWQATGNGPGAILDQFPCTGGASQKFDLIHYGDGYQMKPRSQNTMCVDVAGGSVTNDGKLQQWPCFGGENENFNFTILSGALSLPW